MNFRPLKIYNGIDLAVPLEIQGQPLPINELNGMPTLEACPIYTAEELKWDICPILFFIVLLIYRFNKPHKVRF